MEFEFTDIQPEKNPKTLFVYISYDVKKIFKTLESKTNFQIGEKILTPEGIVMFFELKKDALFFTAKEVATKISGKNTKNICIILTDIEDAYDKLLILQLIAKYIYKFKKYVKKEKTLETKKVYIKDSLKNKPIILDIIQQIEIANINRDFQNEPANIITPETFTQYAKALLKNDTDSNKLDIKVLNEVQLKEQGFNLIYEMGKASVNKPRFMIVKYGSNKPNVKTICLVGKGVTFDSGSINLKPSSNTLFEMKSDKSGATTVISIIKYFMNNSKKFPVKIIGLIPLIENAISGDVVYPGNIIRAYGGKTVEILNNDAEGRLILADALAYSGKFVKEVDYIFDIATLTGDAQRYHCDTSAVILTFNPMLKQLSEKLSEQVGERVYHMPAWPEYMEFTTSEVADVQNNDSSKCKAGAFMASMFLLQFVPKELRKKWMHFDVTHNYIHHLSSGSSTILIINMIKSLL